MSGVEASRVRAFRKGKDRAACAYAARQVLTPCGPPVAVVDMNVAGGRTTPRSICARHLADAVLGERDRGRFIKTSLSVRIRREVERDLLDEYAEEIEKRTQKLTEDAIEEAISQLPAQLAAEIRAVP